jgi:hypothetical protein
MKNSNSSKFLVSYSSLWIESSGRTKSGMAGQSPAVPDNVRLGACPGVFKPPTIVYLLSLSFSYPNRRPQLPISLSGDRTFLGQSRRISKVLLLQGNHLPPLHREVFDLQASKVRNQFFNPISQCILF